jgi:hypothetical protein
VPVVPYVQHCDALATLHDSARARARAFLTRHMGGSLALAIPPDSVASSRYSYHRNMGPIREYMSQSHHWIAYTGTRGVLVAMCW